MGHFKHMANKQRNPGIIPATTINEAIFAYKGVPSAKLSFAVPLNMDDVSLVLLAAPSNGRRGTRGRTTSIVALTDVSFHEFSLSTILTSDFVGAAETSNNGDTFRQSNSVPKKLSKQSQLFTISNVKIAFRSKYKMRYSSVFYCSS